MRRHPFGKGGTFFGKKPKEVQATAALFSKAPNMLINLHEEQGKEIHPGTVLGHFSIVEKIGAGGMGRVFRAHDTRLGRPIALKVLSSELFENNNARARFEREAKLAASIAHANVATIHEIGEQDGLPFIAMELVPGSNLKESILTSGPLSVDQAIDVAIDVCDALEAAHKVGVIHRDIKSSNIMMTPDGRTKVLDFGLAKALFELTQKGLIAKDLTHGDPSMQSSSSSIVPECDPPHSGARGVVLGTPSYMSPEQAWGKPLDERSDLFSLGVVLYECVSGTLPFRGKSHHEILDAVRSEDPTPLATSGCYLPPIVSRVVDKCLDKDPERRYPSAAALRKDLIRVKLSLERSAMPWRRLLKRIAIAAALLPLALAIRGPWRPTSHHIPRVAILPFQAEDERTGHPFLAPLITDALIAGMQSVSGLSVAPYETVHEYARESYPLTPSRAAELCQALGVERLVQGAVRLEDGELEIEVRMSSDDGVLLWSESMSGPRNRSLSTAEAAKEALLQQLPQQEEAAAQTIAQTRSPSMEAYETYMEGRRRYEDWDLEEELREAVGLFQRATEIDPDFAAAYASQVVASVTLFYQTNEAEWMASARGAADRAVALAPALAEAVLAKGIVEWETGNSVEGRESLNRVITMAPGYDMAYRTLANFYAETGQHDRALELFRRGVALRPGSWRGHYSLAHFYLFYLGDFDQAQEHFELADKYHPLGVAPKHALGNIYLREGRLDDAEEMFRRILELSPASARAHHNLGWVYFYRGNIDLAVRSWQTALDRAPDVAEYAAAVGEGMLLLNEQEEANKHLRLAERSYRDMLDGYPEDDFNRTQLSNVLAASGNCAQARAEMAKVLSQQSTSAEFAARGAVTAARCRDVGEAARLALRAINAGDVVDALYHPELSDVRQIAAVREALERRNQ